MLCKLYHDEAESLLSPTYRLSEILARPTDARKMLHFDLYQRRPVTTISIANMATTQSVQCFGKKKTGTSISCSTITLYS